MKISTCFTVTVVGRVRAVLITVIAATCLVAGCSHHEKATGWERLPDPVSPPGSTVVGGTGNGVLANPGIGQVTVGISCQGAGTLKIINAETMVGSVACYSGQGPTAYELNSSTGRGSWRITAPAAVAWKIAAARS